VQFQRIAHIQAELDVLPIARQRRQTVRARLQPPASNNGHGQPDEQPSASDRRHRDTVR
jgi:hypothetical protein